MAKEPTVDRHALVARICGDALEHQPAMRAQFVRDACGDDDDLRREVQSLLQHVDSAEHIIERPVTSALLPPFNTRAQTAALQGHTVSHYRILGELGRGGMGIVFRAEDTKLGRTVALKFLPPELTSDEEAKQRFVQEARTASALDHPNICTIHEIGQTPDGRMFMVMPRYEGETLKARIARGRLPPLEACELALQVARGLRNAHAAGIIHRDIKPANLLLTADGVVKILDFGIAKLTGEIGNTKTGTTLGTVAYMAPEQLRGDAVDQRVDIWAVGVVLYEMVTGRLPFRGDSPVAVMHAVMTGEPPPPRTIVAGIPPSLEAILRMALAKRSDQRYTSIAELIAALEQVRSNLSAPTLTRSLVGLVRRPAVIVVAVLAVLAGAALVARWWTHTQGVRWARAEAIPEIARLVERADYVAAFSLAERARKYVPDDPLLQTLTPQFAATFSIESTPSDAEVFVHTYDAVDGERQHLGRTPLTGVQLPRRAYRWTFEKAAFATTEFATTGQADHFLQRRLVVTLDAAALRAPDMVRIPGGASAGSFNNTMLPPVELESFFLDRYEVTNKAFKEFVNAGGYGNPTYWHGLDSKVVASFVDSTGRPGPSTWELGTYREGEEEHPVTGVNWYEAVAYGRYRGKELPTLHHWAAAALPPYELPSSLAASIVPLSNFASSGPSPVGRHRGMGPYGTYDMHGNVWEWCWNEGPNTQGRIGRYVVGGGWNDPDYMYGFAAAVSPLDRAANRGFRLMKAITANSAPAAARAVAVLQPPRRTGAATQPVGDEVFRGYQAQFAYIPGRLDPTPVETVETTEFWTKQRVLISTGYGKERMAVYLFVPRNAKPPFQPLIYFTGVQAFQANVSSADVQPGFPAMPLDFLVRSGRVMVAPIFQGSFDRFSPLDPQDTVQQQRRLIEWRWDLGRTLDYLGTRSDIDATKAAFVGVSYGASVALPLLALEERLQTALLFSGGLPTTVVPSVVDPINYVPRVTMPVLMMNGRFDYVFPVEETQKPLLNLLGTPRDDKAHLVFDSGHGSPPRAEVLKASLSWLDKYLGAPDDR